MCRRTDYIHHAAENTSSVGRCCCCVMVHVIVTTLTNINGRRTNYSSWYLLYLPALPGKAYEKTSAWTKRFGLIVDRCFLCRPPSYHAHGPWYFVGEDLNQTNPKPNQTKPKNVFLLCLKVLASLGSNSCLTGNLNFPNICFFRVATVTIQDNENPVWGVLYC